MLALCPKEDSSIQTTEERKEMRSYVNFGYDLLFCSNFNAFLICHESEGMLTHMHPIAKVVSDSSHNIL